MGAQIVGGVGGSVAGLVVLYLFFTLWRGSKDDVNDADIHFANRSTSSFSQSSETTASVRGVSKAIRNFRAKKQSIRSGDSRATTEPHAADEVPGMGSRKNSWVDAKAITEGTDGRTFRDVQASQQQNKQPEWLSQYRYTPENDTQEAEGATLPLVRLTTRYTDGSNFAETQPGAATIPGAVVVESEEREEVGTVAVQLLQTKMAQGAIDRQEFEHIRAVMLRSIAVHDSDFSVVATTDV